MAVVLAAFDDSMKEVLALVNKTAYNITLACMSCVAYSLSWQLSTRGYCLIKHCGGAESARAHTLAVWFRDGVATCKPRAAIRLQCKQGSGRGKDETVLCDKLTGRVWWCRVGVVV